MWDFLHVLGYITSLSSQKSICNLDFINVSWLNRRCETWEMWEKIELKLKTGIGQTAEWKSEETPHCQTLNVWRPASAILNWRASVLNSLWRYTKWRVHTHTYTRRWCASCSLPPRRACQHQQHKPTACQLLMTTDHIYMQTKTRS